MLKKQINQEEFNKLINNMNYEAIRAYMILINWKYTDKNGEKYTPSIEKLRVIAEECVLNIYKMIISSRKERHYSKCGGFIADYNPNTNIISLSFIAQTSYYSIPRNRFIC